MPPDPQAPPQRGFASSAFSVVIVTHNRRHIVARAILSALAQDAGAPEVVVVDDASTDGTARYVTSVFPTVRLETRATSDGPSVCRNLGLRLATRRWVVILDDDDELRPDALRVIGERLAAFSDVDRYPVFKFRRSDATLTVPFQLSRVADLSGPQRHGDFASVWNREMALAVGLSYPAHFLGAEGVLWVDIAHRYGLPTWADCVVIAHRDAGSRLSDSTREVEHAVERAKIEDAFVSVLKPYEASDSVRRAVTERTMLGGVYWLLAGRRGLALARARRLLTRRPGAALKLLLAAGLPTRVVVARFHAMRRRAEEKKPEAAVRDTGWA